MAPNAVFWIECNYCPAEGKLSISLTECGHLYCQNCLEKLKSNNNKCLICKRPTSYQNLNEIPDESKDYFKPSNMFDLVSDVIPKLQKIIQIDRFHRKQIQLYVLNKSRKEFMYKKRIEWLMKVLEECRAKIKMLELNLHRQNVEFTPKTASLTASKMSTPNSNAFRTGFLKHNGSRNTFTQTMTSTPFDRNSSTFEPSTRESRPTLMKNITPSHFITPKSMNGSAEQRQQGLIHMNQQLRQQTPSCIGRVGALGSAHKDKFNLGQKLHNISSASGIPLRQSHLKCSTSAGRVLTAMEPPQNVERPLNTTRPSPSLMPYRKLLRTDKGFGMIIKDGLTSGLSSNSQTTSSLQMKPNINSSLNNINLLSYCKRKRT